MRTEDLELAGEVVQDAAAYLGLTDLESTAHFPDHMQDFQAVLAKVCSLSIAQTRQPTTMLCVLLNLLLHTAIHYTSAGSVKEDFKYVTLSSSSNNSS